MDLDVIYYQFDLLFIYYYYVLYCWLDEEWGVDVIVYVGKYGMLEWLLGKGVGLFEECFLDVLLGDVLLFYFFIINDFGEGLQVKCCVYVVVVDYLMLFMIIVDSYGVLVQLMQLVDEYYQVEVFDLVKLLLLQQQIWELVWQINLDMDL